MLGDLAKAQAILSLIEAPWSSKSHPDPLRRCSDFAEAERAFSAVPDG
jgi:hypothetical protein